MENKLEFEKKLKANQTYYDNIDRLKPNNIIKIKMANTDEFCKDLIKPFDNMLCRCMVQVAQYLCSNLPYVDFAYYWYDEIVLSINDIILDTDSIHKITSRITSITTLEFNKIWAEIISNEWGEEFYEDKRILELNPRLKAYKNNFFKAEFESTIFPLDDDQMVFDYLAWLKDNIMEKSTMMAIVKKVDSEQIDYESTIAKWKNWNSIYKTGILI